MKRNVCRTCKLFVKEGLCPICRKDSYSQNWNGRIFVLDHAKSLIAQKMEIVKDGEYALKVK